MVLYYKYKFTLYLSQYGVDVVTQHRQYIFTDKFFFHLSSLL